MLMIEHYCVMCDQASALYDHHDAYEHLTYIGDKLKTHNIKYWLMLDTLLGAIKDNDILKSVNGISLGTSIDNYKKILAMNDMIKKDGYRFTESHVTGNEYPSGKDKSIWRVSVNIYYFNKEVGDISFFSKFPDKIMRRYDKNIDYWPSIFTVPEWFFDKMGVVKIRKALFPVPRAPDVLLDYWYGTKWRDRSVVNHRNSVKNLKSKLSFLIKYADKSLRATSNEAKYTYPIDQIEWIKENDPVRR